MHAWNRGFYISDFHNKEMMSLLIEILAFWVRQTEQSDGHPHSMCIGDPLCHFLLFMEEENISKIIQ